MNILKFWIGKLHWVFFWLALVYFFKTGSCRLVIHISQRVGKDTPDCLRNDCVKSSKTCECKSLAYALERVIASNETVMDIKMEDLVYIVKKPLRIELKRERNLWINISPGNSRMSNASMRCTGESSKIFEKIMGDNLSLEFRNIAFEKCGCYKTCMPAVMIKNTYKVSFFSCIFQDNWSGGFLSINSVVHIENCKFESNSAETKGCANVSHAMGGAAGFLFESQKRKMSVNIYRSHFIENRVHANNDMYYLSDKDLKGQTVRGGAVHITFRGISKILITVNVRKCRFERNLATIGGALNIQSFNTALNNIIHITETNFSGNNGTQLGGAFAMSLWDNSVRNNLHMTDNVMENNWSRGGSGIYIYLLNSVSGISDKQTFSFKRVLVRDNTGPIGNTGSAVKIVSPQFGYHSMEVMPVFEDCTFSNNTNNGFMASFVVDRVDITFKGTNVFNGNKYFGAALFSSSLLHVHGKLDFIGNVGSIGGAVVMSNSQIVLFPGAHVLFKDNEAFIGGAIYVVTNPIYRVASVNNPRCFITYSEKNARQSSWNVSLFKMLATVCFSVCVIN